MKKRRLRSGSVFFEPLNFNVNYDKVIKVKHKWRETMHKSCKMKCIFPPFFPFLWLPTCSNFRNPLVLVVIHLHLSTLSTFLCLNFRVCFSGGNHYRWCIQHDFVSKTAVIISALVIRWGIHKHWTRISHKHHEHFVYVQVLCGIMLSLRFRFNTMQRGLGEA